MQGRGLGTELGGASDQHGHRWGRPWRGLVLSIGLAFGAAAPLGACDVLGQSGSEGHAGAGPGGAANDQGGGDVVACPCEAAGTFLRVTLLTREGAEVTLRIAQVIHGETSWRAGDELRATDGGQLPCYLGVSNIDVGGDALAVFEPASSCDASDCANALGSVRMTPWANELLMAETAAGRLSVPARELENLWGNVNECLDRYGLWAELPGAFDGEIP
jgi:hypothetical protein